MTGSRLAFTTLLIAAALAAACIEVGHEAETGCFVEPSQPGCKPGGSAGTASQSNADAGAGGQQSTEGGANAGTGGAGGNS